MAYCGPRGIPLSQFLSWSTADQDAALGWAAHEARRCSSCGRHPDDGVVHVHEDICPGCAALERHRDAEHEPGARTHLQVGDVGTCTRCAQLRQMNGG